MFCIAFMCQQKNKKNVQLLFHFGHFLFDTFQEVCGGSISKNVTIKSEIAFLPNFCAIPTTLKSKQT